MQNQKAADVKTNEAKTDYPSATVGGKRQIHFRFSHAENAFKSNDEV